MDSISPLPPSIEEELLGFDRYMHRVRGLAPTTRRNRIRIVHGLLRTRFVGQPVELSALQPDEVRQFIAEQPEHRSSISHARAVATALRAYFRYRAGCGDQTDALAGVISSPAQWRLSSLPRSRTDDEVERLLGSFTPDVPSRRRGYAMVRCGLDMGLRSGEIAKLALPDIDWHTGIRDTAPHQVSPGRCSPPAGAHRTGHRRLSALRASNKS